MKKSAKLRICNWSLLLLTVAMFASAIQLEINPTGACMWVWLHIIIGIVFMSDIFVHLHFHKWPIIMHSHCNKHLWLGSLLVLTLLSGIIATIHWLMSFVHSVIGGIHGKLGFMMIIVVAVHVRRHIRFYKFKKQF